MMTLCTRSDADLGLSGTRDYLLAGAVPPGPRLAVVGSRAARRDRIGLLDAVIAAAKARGLALVSGGAVGIDAGAHRAALAAELPQLAVLPCGPDRPYPPQHVGLFEAIAAAPGSGLLYCHPPGAETCRAMFASRNAVVVGLARAVLVVEAQARSGSVGTGRLALKKGLPVAAVLGAPGCAELVGSGARALPCEPAAFVPALAAWLGRVVGGGAEVEPPPAWPENLAWLAAALERAGPRGICLDDLDRPLARLAELLAAERQGLIVESPPGRYRRVRQTPGA